MSNLTKEEKKRIKEYLGRKLSEGKLILFTGAGFSANAKDKKGRNLPLASQLAQEIAYIIKLDDPEVTLKDAFHLAKLKKNNEISKYLKERLNVDEHSLDEMYKFLINQPWYKAYTLNVDNLFMVAYSKFRFNRRIVCISNLTHNQKSHISTPKDLIVTHINGMLEDIPDAVTFSQEQYFERMTLTDSCYSVIASEILQYPFIFFGSKLDEDMLWQYIYLRKQKGSIRNLRDFRPRSFIVIPELSPSKQALLKEHNIKWIPQTCEEFVKDFLYLLESESKIGFMKIQKKLSESKITTIPIVSDLISIDAQESPKRYLLGAEPSWKDIYSNSIIERDKEKEWIQEVNKYVETNKSSPTPVFIFTGTAGDGKTSIAMRFAVHLINNQQTVGWIDRNSNIPPGDIEKLTENTENLQVLFIDTPDMYGLKISQVVSRLALKKKLKFIVLVVRSSKVDSLVKTPLFDSSIPTKEFVTYKLTDVEISKLLNLLEEKKLIGALKDLPRKKQLNIFRQKSDRQLIVAMIEATSGKDFSEKICEEFEQLENNSKLIYCLVAIATLRKHYLLREDILLGIGEDSSNETIHEIDQLVRRGLLIENKNQLQIRHRVIAQKVSDRLSTDNLLIQFYIRLAYIAAIKATQQTSEQKRMKRLLKTLLNHEFLLKISSNNGEAQDLYETIENLLKNNYHFWLQRGCFELAIGNLSLARNYLNQAYALNNLDNLVILSLENLNFKEAIINPNTEKAHTLANNAYNNIVSLIEQRGKLDSYPYHVLGMQGLQWAKKGIKDTIKRKKYLEDLLSILEKGVKNHKRSSEIKEMRDKVQLEILHFFVRN